ncbi:mitochondrial transcription rescue factor 1 [Planococcus citri]|uniref:mitochondrial transcription rescue factor 1 n=1 Tax=Planococcus citri TaxID=170843 RepID=UPI0031F890EE
MQNFGRILHRILKYETPNYVTNRQLAVFSKSSATLHSYFRDDTLTGNAENNYGIDFLKNFMMFPSQIRWKSLNQIRRPGSKSSEYESGSDSDSDDDIPQETHGSKVVQIQTDSLRCDLILKNGLTISRNKLETYFYEGRIRINGLKIMKKSVNVELRDEVDVIKKFDEENPELLHVGRVEILKAKPSGDFILITVRRFKNLLVPNYEKDPWVEKVPEKESEENEENENEAEAKPKKDKKK